VGKRKANAFGLYDVHGNVREWVGDWYRTDYDTVSIVDPQGPAEATTARVFRGGCSFNGADLRRSAARHPAGASYADAAIGFRVAVEID
jgi:formylglycine-generating enzyme required for sulfatase activity